MLEPAIREIFPAAASEYPEDIVADPEAEPDTPDSINKLPLDPVILEPVLIYKDPPKEDFDDPDTNDIEPPFEPLSAKPPKIFILPPSPPPLDIPPVIFTVPPDDGPKLDPPCIEIAPPSSFEPTPPETKTFPPIEPAPADTDTEPPVLGAFPEENDSPAVMEICEPRVEYPVPDLISIEPGENLLTPVASDREPLFELLSPVANRAAPSESTEVDNSMSPALSKLIDPLLASPLPLKIKIEPPTLPEPVLMVRLPAPDKAAPVAKSRDPEDAASESPEYNFTSPDDEDIDVLDATTT